MPISRGRNGASGLLSIGIAAWGAEVGSRLSVRRVLLGRGRLSGRGCVLDRFALRAHLRDTGAGEAHPHGGGDFELDLTVVDRLGDLSDQTARGDNDIATPGRLHQFALLLGAAL